MRRIGFIAEFKKRFRKFIFAHAVHEYRCGLAAGWVHSHVERAGLAIGKPSLRVIDLRAGDTDIGEHCIDATAFDICLGEHPGEAGEVRVKEIEAPADSFKFRLCCGEIGGIEVYADKPAARLRWTEAFENCRGMPATTDGAIDDYLARLGREDIKHLLQQDGNVQWCVRFFHVKNMVRSCQYVSAVKGSRLPKVPHVWAAVAYVVRDCLGGWVRRAGGIICSTW